jgi:ribosome-associated protein
MSRFIPLEQLENEMTFTASFSSGAGGQSVNRTESKATGVWKISDSVLITEEEKQRLFHTLKSQIIGDGQIQVSSQVHRSQGMNKKECVEKLHLIIQKGLVVPKKRKKTKPTKSSQKKRVDSKKRRGEVKSMRSNKNWD